MNDHTGQHCSPTVPPTWTPLADIPGLYVDGNRLGHLLAHEFLEAHGVACTPANNAMLALLAREVMEEQGIPVSVERKR